MPIDSVNEPFYCAGMLLNIHVLVYCGGTMTKEELITILWAIEKASISRGAAIKEAYAKGYKDGYKQGRNDACDASPIDNRR